MSNSTPRGFMAATSILTASIGNAWEERLRHWSRPASETEEASIERAARMVRDAIEVDPWMRREGVTVRPQGSYFNNTNVRVESDMDIRIVHPTIHVEYDPRHVAQASVYADTGGFTWLRRSSNDIAGELRQETERALRYAFDGVDPGKKAFRIPKVQGSRSDIDVAPTLRLHLITPTMRNRSLMEGPAMDRVEGVALFDTDDKLTINFPEQHHLNGKAKWRDTGRRFKKVVRQLKKMKDHLIAEGKLDRGTIPSFLVENLVYNVEDDLFLGRLSRRDRLKSILSRSFDQVSDHATEMREIGHWKMLFGSHASWTPEDCKSFIALSYAEIQ